MRRATCSRLLLQLNFKSAQCIFFFWAAYQIKIVTDKMKHVIVDVDAGTDDAAALMLLLTNEENNHYKVIAITCTHGNTTIDNVVRNVLLTLESINRLDVPIFKGATSSLLGKSDNTPKFHGADGFGDKSLLCPNLKIEEESAVVAIQKLTKQYPGLTFISLGPLTNLALAVRENKSLAESIGEIWIMGGNTAGIGNVEGTTAEFNFYQDPEAAHIVLSSYQCPITLLPWEPCINCPYSVEWRFQILGAANTKHMQLLNNAEGDLYANSTCWNPCDALLAASFINNQIITSSRYIKLVVELCGTYTRGQCVVLDNSPTNVKVIDGINFETIKNMFMDLAQYNY